jgi:ABC-type multidrug transport system fused ATPase/permease subunit
MKAWLLETLVPYRTQLALMLGMQLFMAFLVAIQPLFFQQLLGLLIDGSLAAGLSRALALTLTLAGLFLLVSISQGVDGYIAALFSSELLRRLQTKCFAKTAQLPLNYFKHHSAGEFFTRFNHDVGQAQRFVAHMVPTFIREGVTLCVLICILLWAGPWQLVVTAVLVTALSTALAIWFHRLLERFAIKQRAGWSEINRQFDETVRGIDTIKTFGAEARRSEIFERQTAGFRSLSANAGKISALFSPAIELTTRLGSLVLVVIAYRMIAGNTLTAETFLLFFFCAALLQAAAMSMIQLYTQMPSQFVGIQNLAGFFMETEEEAEDRDLAVGCRQGNPVTIDRAMPIEFRNLHFAYPNGKELYGGAHLRIPANSITVVQGPNGCGKSTLINLLLKFNAPNRGRITIGGLPLSQYTRQELRTKISVVTQYHHIFHDSLRENLLVAKPDATDNELLTALAQVGMLDFVHRLPHGLAQTLDSLGKGLSGGERQRLCIARLLLRKSPILVLDEPWSNLDAAAGSLLVEVLDRLRGYCTLIVITHQGDNVRLTYDHEILLGGGTSWRSMGAPQTEVPLTTTNYQYSPSTALECPKVERCDGSLRAG